MPAKQATPPGQEPVDHEQGKSQFDYDFAEGWQPKPDEVIEGTIKSIDTGASEYGSYPIVTIQRADGTAEAVHCFHTALRSQLARIKPHIGQVIGIKYLGKTKAKNPTAGRSDYDNYRVIVPQGGGGYDWSSEESFTPDAGDVPY